MTEGSSSSTTLFVRLGGTPAVRAAVDEFYKRILDDERLAFFFDSTTVPQLKLHQLEFFKLAFGRMPDDLDVPKMLYEKHHRLFVEQGLNETHFDMVAGHFAATLQHMEISQELIDEATAVVLPLRPVFEKGAKEATSSKSSSEEKKEEPNVLHASEPGAKQETLMDKLGGNAAVKAAVEGLYTKLLDDPDLAPFFNEVNMPNLKIHQIEFMKVAFTQIPDDLDVAALMKDKHASLFKNGLNEKHFDKVAGHFVAVLKELNVPQELIDEAVAVIGPLRGVFEEGAKEAQERASS